MKKRILFALCALVLLTVVILGASALAGGTIDAARAQEIALAHAGVDASAAAFTKVKLDDDIYELKFSCGNDQYEYVLSSETGEILNYQWDLHNGAQTASGGQAAASAPAEDAANLLTAGEVLDTALALAGVSDFSKVDLDQLALDGGVYKIEFKIDRSQYKYEISAATGEILAQELPEQEDSEHPSAADDGWITSSEAEDAALEHAGVDRTETTYIHSYIRYYHGAPYAYQVEFGVRSSHYWYSVDLSTGEILSQNNAGH